MYIRIHIYVYTYMYVHNDRYTYICTFTMTGLFDYLDVFYRVAKTHRVHYLYRTFSAKVTYIYWLFCGK